LGQVSRDERLKANLRANLKRRKLKARAKAEIEKDIHAKGQGVKNTDEKEGSERNES
jgi:hypothetical protein